MAKIGFIGLGIMGKPMARNLMKAGHSLTVHDVAPGPVAELVKEGAVRGNSSRETAALSEIVITMLPDGPQVETVDSWTRRRPGRGVERLHRRGHEFHQPRGCAESGCSLRGSGR